MKIIRPTETAVDRAIQSVTTQDAFLDELMRDFRLITPEVGESVANLFFEATDRAVRIPRGHRRTVGKLAILLAACASASAIILDEVGDMGGERQEATARAFRELLTQARKNAASKRLDKILGHA